MRDWATNIYPLFRIYIVEGFKKYIKLKHLPSLINVFNNFRPEKLKKYNCSGTIADFAVAMLCNLDKPVMSYQMAASWGYFNCRTSTWNSNLLKEANFPIDLLPEVSSSGSIAGRLAGCWHSIPQETPVGKTTLIRSLKGWFDK